jgi:hypothetical protein
MVAEINKSSSPDAGLTLGKWMCQGRSTSDPVAPDEK